jgi:hypothetical protein
LNETETEKVTTSRSKYIWNENTWAQVLEPAWNSAKWTPYTVRNAFALLSGNDLRLHPNRMKPILQWAIQTLVGSDKWITSNKTRAALRSLFEDQKQQPDSTRSSASMPTSMSSSSSSSSSSESKKSETETKPFRRMAWSPELLAYTILSSGQMDEFVVFLRLPREVVGIRDVKSVFESTLFKYWLQKYNEKWISTAFKVLATTHMQDTICEEMSLGTDMCRPVDRARADLNSNREWLEFVCQLASRYATNRQLSVFALDTTDRFAIWTRDLLSVLRISTLSPTEALQLVRLGPGHVELVCQLVTDGTVRLSILKDMLRVEEGLETSILARYLELVWDSIDQSALVSYLLQNRLEWIDMVLQLFPGFIINDERVLEAFAQRDAWAFIHTRRFRFRTTIARSKYTPEILNYCMNKCNAELLEWLLDDPTLNLAPYGKEVNVTIAQMIQSIEQQQNPVINRDLNPYQRRLYQEEKKQCPEWIPMLTTLFKNYHFLSALTDKDVDSYAKRLGGSSIQHLQQVWMDALLQWRNRTDREKLQFTQLHLDDVMSANKAAMDAYDTTTRALSGVIGADIARWVMRF